MSTVIPDAVPELMPEHAQLPAAWPRSRRARYGPPAALAVVLLVLGGAGMGQAKSRYGNTPADVTQFNFARVVYDSVGGMSEAYYSYEGRIWQRWETDFPQADQNLSRRIAQLTSINVNASATTRRLDAPDLGDFPMLYISDPGWMMLSDAERAGLRQYLDNGGFVWVDDFWGDGEWNNWEREMRHVMPERRWREVPMAHPIFGTVFEIDRVPQIPAHVFASPGGPTTEPEWIHRYPVGSMERATMRGWFDDSGRLMVIATHNTDIADGWEREAYGRWYFEEFSTPAYALAVNVIIYALTR